LIEDRGVKSEGRRGRKERKGRERKKKESKRKYFLQPFFNSSTLAPAFDLFLLSLALTLPTTNKVLDVMLQW